MPILQVMSTLHDDIKSVILLMVCDTHHKHPVIVLHDGRFTLSCCCDDFKMHCYNQIIALLKSGRAKPLAVAWKKTEDNSVEQQNQQ